MKFVILAVSLVMASSTSNAEVPSDPAHDLFHHYYQYWYNGRGTHCCDDTHCKVRDSSYFRFHEGRREVLMPDGWRPIIDSDYVRDDGGLGPFGTICSAGETLYCVDWPDPGI